MTPAPPLPPPRRRPGRWLKPLGWIALLAPVALLALRESLFRGPLRTRSPLSDERIVDLHCHVAGIGAGNSGCRVSPALRHNVRFRIYLDAFGVTAEELEREGDQLLVSRLSRDVAASHHLSAAVILALDGVVDSRGHLDTNRTEVYIPNSFVAEAAGRHTNLLFGASVHPRRTNALEQLDSCAAQGAVLVKWIPSIMDIDPADPRFLPFYQKLKQLRLPLLTHTGSERSFTSAQDDLADPERLRLPLSEGVTVIAAHAALERRHDGTRDFDRLRMLMREFPNLYADLSSLTQINKPGALRDALADPICRTRLIYGSDFPLINTPLVSPWYFPLNLTRSEMSRIAAVTNAWDRDIALKQSLGVPPDVFVRAPTVIRRPRPAPNVRPTF